MVKITLKLSYRHQLCITVHFSGGGLCWPMHKPLSPGCLVPGDLDAFHTKHYVADLPLTSDFWSCQVLPIQKRASSTQVTLTLTQEVDSIQTHAEPDGSDPCNPFNSIPFPTFKEVLRVVMLLDGNSPQPQLQLCAMISLLLELCTLISSFPLQFCTICMVTHPQLCTL